MKDKILSAVNYRRQIVAGKLGNERKTREKRGSVCSSNPGMKSIL